MKTTQWHWAILISATVCTLGACSDDETTNQPTTTTAGPGGGGASGGAGGSGATGGGFEQQENVYVFESRFSPGESAVAYNGQAYRHALIEAMKTDIGGLTTILDDDSYNPADAQAVFDRLNFYYEHDGDSAGDVPLGFSTDPPAAQATFGDYPSTANLNGKLAGNDAVTDYKDWSTEFVGWSDASIAASGGDESTPEGLLQAFMWTLADAAYQRSIDVIPNEPGTTTPVAQVYVTETGLDLQQLIQKFTLMAVTYAQVSDDYLHRDPTQVEKGILASNAQDEDKPYSALGHHWDEGFGYFGAARDYVLYTDGEIAASGDGRADWQGYHDTDGDGAIDLLSERNWGASVNAAKRDLGATDATDFTLEAISAFYQGRLLILNAGDTLTAEELDALEGHAGAAIAAWEKAIAATIVHYINDVIADTQAIDGSGYVFADHAKHWSEMKGFALGLQFNPNKMISDSDFADLHTAMGDAPVLATAPMPQRTMYIADLMDARTILMNAYGFSQANVENW